MKQETRRKRININSVIIALIAFAFLIVLLFEYVTKRIDISTLADLLVVFGTGLLALATFLLVRESQRARKEENIKRIANQTVEWARRIAVISHELDIKRETKALEIEKQLQECWEWGKYIIAVVKDLNGLKYSVSEAMKQLENIIALLDDDIERTVRRGNLSAEEAVVTVLIDNNKSTDDFRQGIIESTNRVITAAADVIVGHTTNS